MHSTGAVYRRRSIDKRFSTITRHLPAPIVINCRRHFVTEEAGSITLWLLTDTAEYSNAQVTLEIINAVNIMGNCNAIFTDRVSGPVEAIVGLCVCWQQLSSETTNDPDNFGMLVHLDLI